MSWLCVIGWNDKRGSEIRVACFYSLHGFCDHSVRISVGNSCWSSRMFCRLFFNHAEDDCSAHWCFSFYVIDSSEGAKKLLRVIHSLHPSSTEDDVTKWIGKIVISSRRWSSGNCGESDVGNSGGSSAAWRTGTKLNCIGKSFHFLDHISLKNNSIVSFRNCKY